MRIEIGKDPNGTDWRDKVTLHLEADDIPRSVIIRRGDRVIAEVFANVVTDHETLWHEVEIARRLEAIPHLLRGMVNDVVGAGGTSERDRMHYFVGVIDAMKGRDPEHDVDATHPPDDRKATKYAQGYRDGVSIGVACQKIFEMKRTGPGPMVKG